MKLPSKEPLNRDTKSLSVPPYISAKGVDNVNQSSQYSEKKNAHLHNVIKNENKLTDEQNMDEAKKVNNTFKMRLVNRIENWSPLTAKYARLSIFGCKVCIIYLYL